MADRRLTASGLRDWAHAAVGGLVVHADEINRLNVFPVADADTGANMLFTMRSALAEVEKLEEDPHRDMHAASSVVDVSGALARGALHGARGNSGVILSQILRGLADVVAEAADAQVLTSVDSALFGAALARGASLIVASMGETVDGTIVSVLQAAADAAAHRAAGGEHLPQTVLAAAHAAVVALEKTPEQLDVLAAAGVVDAGGRGLLVLLDALAATLTGHTPHRQEYVPSPASTESPRRPTADRQAPQYEVMYQMSGCVPGQLDPLRGRLEEIGDSVAIASDGSDLYSVHVHADDAGAAIEAGLAYGMPSRIQISTLRTGTASGRWTRRRAVLAVVSGQGAEELFGGEGAHVLRCDDLAGAPINAADLLRALVDTGAGQVMVLPNGYIAAEELVAGCAAASGWGLDAVPLPTGSMVQGLAALAVHEAGRPAVDDGYTMTRAAGATRHGSVRLAAERALTWAGPCHPGDGLGIAGDEVLVVGPDIVTAATGLLDLLMAAGGELITVLMGAEVADVVHDELAAHVRRRHLGVELVTYRTDHLGDALLIGVE